MAEKKIRLFIIGMPRSGTKLLRSILNRHPLIFIPEIETEFYSFLENLLKSKPPTDERRYFHQIYTEIIGLPFFTYLGEMGYLVEEEKWFSQCDEFTAAGIFEGLFSLLANEYKPEASLFGDKSPSYIDIIPLLLKDFPHAKFIHIVRDVRDYALSINGAWGKNILRASYRWKLSVGSVIDNFSDHQDRLFEVRYEDLLDAPESSVKKLCNFLDIAFETDMLALDEVIENLGDTRESVGIVEHNTQKYLQKMDIKEISEVEKLTGDILRGYGYPVGWEGEIKELSPFMEKFYQVLDGINLIRFEKKSRGLVGAVVFYWRYYRATRAIT